MSMKKNILRTALLGTLTACGIGIRAQAQEMDWKVNFDYLLDNTAFPNSNYAGSRTLHATMIRPIVGLKWADRHAVYGGVHLKKIPGTEKIIDRAELTLYYDYNSSKVHFRAGVFPRAEVLPQYWTQFYSSGYRSFNYPQMHGYFLQIGQQSGSFINTWLDWKGYASATRRGSFLIGASGQYKSGLFFADFQSYLHGVGKTSPADVGNATVQNHWLLQSTAGVSFNRADSFNGLVAVGIMAGHECDKATDRHYTPVGFVGRVNLEYWGIGTRNLTYVGKPQMNMYWDFGAELYLATPFYRGNFYHRNDLYINLLQSNNIKAELASMHHFSEGRVHFQQAITLRVNLDKNSSKKPWSNKFLFPWKRIFE